MESYPIFNEKSDQLVKEYKKVLSFLKKSEHEICLSITKINFDKESDKIRLTLEQRECWYNGCEKIASRFIGKTEDSENIILSWSASKNKDGWLPLCDHNCKHGMSGDI